MLLPVAIDIAGRRVLVVGGGSVAARKVASLLECGALVTVLAPELGADFSAPIEHLARSYHPGDGAGFALIFAATNRRDVNALVASEARAQGSWCNIADDPQVSDFHTTSVVRRGEITVGISTQGVSPVLARHVREQIEATLGEEYAVLIELVSQLSIPINQRGDFWRRVLASEALEMLRAGQQADALRCLVVLREQLVSDGD